MRKNLLFLVSILSVFVFGCDDKSYKPLPPIDGGPDADVDADAGDADADVVEDFIITPDDLDADENGPQVTILAPASGETLNGTNYLIRATVTAGADAVAYDSITAWLDSTEYAMTADSETPNGFKITVDISGLQEGQHLVRVTARDVSNRLGYADVYFNYDKGPIITVYSPSVNGRYHGGMNVSFRVRDDDGVQASSVQAVLASQNLALTQGNVSTETANGNPVWIDFSTTVLFNDPMFSPPLDGVQRITVSAENSLGNSADKSVDFVVDNTGPVIQVTSHTEGQIIGSITHISATITDEAGVLASSVTAVIGNNDVQYTLPLRAAANSDVYEGSFDTTVLPSTFVWPALQVFATDLLGNESSVAFQLALDNQPPLASLDPPENMRMAKKNSSKQLECSLEFDPVGWNSANDGTQVAQVFWLRARVEDRGNGAYGAMWSPLALVNQSAVELYILDDTSQALVVDRNGDGICNDINPNLLPTVTLSGDPRETLKLNMVALKPAGTADYRPDMITPTPPPPCQAWGVATDPPDFLCPVVEDDLNVLIWYTFDKAEPAIYGLPPFNASSPLYCSGIQFDARANNIAEGWACIAVKAIDNVGNVGVSAPLRVCIDYNPYDGITPPDCMNLSNPPNCTGTWDANTSTVLPVPCQPRLFPAQEVLRED